MAGPAEQIRPGQTEDPYGRGTVTRPLREALLTYLRVTVEVFPPPEEWGSPPYTRLVQVRVRQAVVCGVPSIGAWRQQGLSVSTTLPPPTLLFWGMHACWWGRD